MFLILNSIVASLDGLVIGIGLRLSNVVLDKKNLFTIFLGNILIYTFFLTLYYYFQLTFMTKFISTCLYLFLAWRSFKEEHKVYDKNLSFFECVLLTLTHSLDGTLISLNFVYAYTIPLIVCIFSLSSILVLLFGYYGTCLFKNIKNSHFVSAILFLLLAIINQFF